MFPIYHPKVTDRFPDQATETVPSQPKPGEKWAREEAGQKLLQPDSVPHTLSRLSLRGIRR
jgi:hypothetical protein